MAGDRQRDSGSGGAGEQKCERKKRGGVKGEEERGGGRGN